MKKKASSFLGKLRKIYLEEYRKLLLIPIGLFIVSAVILGINYSRTGDFINRDVTLKGGITVTVTTERIVTVAELEEALQSKFPGSSIHVRLASSYGKQTGLIIEASDIEEQGIIPALEEIIGDLDPDQYSIEKMGSSLGASFFKEIFVTLTVAFFMMGLVFYYYFRSLVATSAALISAFFDLFITLGIITLLGVRLTSGGIASFLMMIGYSIDTSILLSTKLLKGSGKVEESLFGAMRTGLTMSAAGIAATGLSFLLTNNEALRQIMLILVIGLSVDVITTWIENTALLRIYLEKKNVKN